MPETSKGNSECSFCRGEPITDNWMGMEWKFSLYKIEFFYCVVAELVMKDWVPWRGHFRIHYCPMCGEMLRGGRKTACNFCTKTSVSEIVSEYETDRITIIVCDEITRIDAVEHVSAAMNNWEKGKKWFGWSGIDVAIDDAGNWIVHRDRRGRWSDGHCRKCGDKVGGD